MSNKRQIAYLIKIGVIILLFGVVWYKVANNQNFSDIKTYITSTLMAGNHLFLLFLTIILMPLNWFIESSKWQILINKIEPISKFNSLKAILAGVTVSMFTPNRIGEYAGRVLYVSHKNRIIAALSTLIGSIGQLVVTIIFGSISFYLYYLHFLSIEHNTWLRYYLLALLMLLVIISVIFFISTPLLIGLLKRIRVIKKFKKYVTFFNRYTVSELFQILILSSLRYIVYCVQLYLLYVVFQVDLSPNIGFILIPISFFIMTIIPSIALAELGIREAVAISVIGLVSDNHLGILCATFMLWVINLIIPSAMGSLLILKAKIFKQRRS